MATVLSLNPLLRNIAGFDRFDELNALMQPSNLSSSSPPYNIERQGEDRFSITMAVPGFSEGDLAITASNNRLTIAGTRDESPPVGEYLHHGLEIPAFEHSFRLAPHMKVVSAELQHGLLRVELLREIPEEQRPRTIPIRTAAVTTAIEHKHKNKQ